MKTEKAIHDKYTSLNEMGVLMKPTLASCQFDMKFEILGFKNGFAIKKSNFSDIDNLIFNVISAFRYFQ